MGWFNHQLVMFGRLDVGGYEPFKDEYSISRLLHSCLLNVTAANASPCHKYPASKAQMDPQHFLFESQPDFFWKCSTILLMVQNSGDHQLRFGSVNDICKRIVFLCLRGHPKGNIDLTSVFLSHFWTSWTSRNIAISWNRDTLNSPCFCQTIVVIGFLGPKSEKIRLNFPRNLHRIESRWRNSQKVD